MPETTVTWPRARRPLGQTVRLPWSTLTPWIDPARRLSAAVAAPHPRLWVLILALVAVDAMWLVRSGIRLEPMGFGIVAGLVLALLGAAAFWGAVRSEPTLRAMALSSACLLAFTVPLAVLHYLAATLDRPLVDGALARAEAALGFDWPAYLGFLEAHPALNWWLSLAYHSSGPQIGLVVIVLGATRRLARLWAFVRLFAATLLCVVAVSALFPAVGAFAHYGLGAVAPDRIETMGALWHLDPLARLRAGTLDVIALGEIRGLVTFPSFHVCLALLTAWALAPVPLLGPLALVVNAAIVVATVGTGGHYLPDVLAGGLLTLGMLAVRERRRSGPRRAALAQPRAPARVAGHP